MNNEEAVDETREGEVVDFTMCVDDVACPRASNCKRSAKSGTKPSEWQSYSSLAPKKELIDMCQFYSPIYSMKYKESPNEL